METNIKDENKYAALRLDNQLCFPLYAVSKEITHHYKPFLDKLDLTYTQYITMMVIWEEERVNVKELCCRLHLDSGTLTPVLKKLENKGYITRARSTQDERNLIVTVTGAGMKLRDDALTIPEKMGSCISLSEEEFVMLYKLLYRMLDAFCASDESGS